MIHTDRNFSARVESEVARIEATTDAEVVVVAAPRSGSYADVTTTAASVAALLAFAVLLVVPWQVHPVFGLLDLVLTWVLARWLLDEPWFLRRVTRAERRERQVADAAAAVFHQEAVHGTPHRLALLVYVSALEGQVELIPDLGLEARIPRGRWASVAEDFSHDDLEHFVAGLKKVGELLAADVPATGTGPDHLSNAPRIRS